MIIALPGRRLLAVLAGVAIAGVGFAEDRPPPLPIEPTGVIESLPEQYPESWFLVHDAGFFHMSDGKMYVIDRERTYLGSVNLDPRSRHLNTEMGVIIDNVDLAAEAADALLDLMTFDNAWDVTLGPDGRPRWQDTTRQQHRQPARGPAQRIVDTALGLLPIQSYL